MKIILFCFDWNYGGIEMRLNRFYTNLKMYSPNNDIRLYSINASGRKSVNSPQMPGVRFISLKNFLLLTRNLSKEDFIIMFASGDNKFDKKAIISGEMPSYFEFFRTKAIKGLYMFGHYATKFNPFFKEMIDAVDFMLSSFLVPETSDKFYIKNYNNTNKYNEGEKIHFKKPIWWFNILLSPLERKFAIQKIKDKNFSYKNLKRIVFTGRVTFEKDIDNIVKNFINLSENKKKFILDIHGDDNNSRQLFFLKQKYGEKINEFLKGRYNAFLESRKILQDANIGINLRKKIVEDNFVIENTVLEYIIYGVVPIINEEFKSKKDFIIPLRTLDLNESNSITQLVLENYNKKKFLDDIRMNNLIHVLLYNNGKNIVKGFYQFLEEYKFIK